MNKAMELRTRSRIDVPLATFADRANFPISHVMAPILTDLMRYCELEDIDFEEALKTARAWKDCIG